MQINQHAVIIPNSSLPNGELVGKPVNGCPLILFPAVDKHAQVAMLAYIESLRKDDPAQADEWMKMLEMLDIKIIPVREILAGIQKAASQSL